MFFSNACGSFCGCGNYGCGSCCGYRSNNGGCGHGCGHYERRGNCERFDRYDGCGNDGRKDYDYGCDYGCRY